MDPVNSGVPVFATASIDINDISEAQTVDRPWYDEREEAWRGSMRFYTYRFYRAIAFDSSGTAASGNGGATAAAPTATADDDQPAGAGDDDSQGGARGGW